MLLQKLFAIKRITVLGVYKDIAESEYTFTAIIVEKKQNELNVVKRETFTGTEGLKGFVLGKRYIIEK